MLLGRTVLSKGSVAEESIFRALCKTGWQSVSDERFQSEWRPVLSSWKSLYRVLHEWIPREGFYSLLEANPWGMIVRMRFHEGAFVGEMLCPREESQTLAGQNAFKYEQVLRIQFSKEDGSIERAHVVYEQASQSGGTAESENGLSGTSKVADARPNAKEEAIITLEGCNHAIVHPFRHFTGFPAVVPSARAIQIRPMSASTGLISRLRSFASHSSVLDALQPTSQRERVAREMLHNPSSSTSNAGTFCHLFAHMGNLNLTLDWIDGPTRTSSFVYREGMPLLRPGLYSGVYEEVYGKYKREVILIEYRQYKLPLETREDVWKLIGKEIFNQNEQRDSTDAFLAVQTGVNAALGNSEDSVVFVVGRKITGDVHVPMRQLTFGAIVHPALILPGADGEKPNIGVVRDRGGMNQNHQVTHSWSGWGTLAYPRFESPSWSRGMLVQVERSTNGAGSSGQEKDDSFGFVWSRERTGDGGTELAYHTSIFRRLKSQDKFPWFS